VPCLPYGTGGETFFRLRAAGYLGGLGKRSMGHEPGPWRMVWSMTGLVYKDSSIKGTKIILCFTSSLIKYH